MHTHTQTQTHLYNVTHIYLSTFSLPEFCQAPVGKCWLYGFVKSRAQNKRVTHMNFELLHYYHWQLSTMIDHCLPFLDGKIWFFWMGRIMWSPLVAAHSADVQDEPPADPTCVWCTPGRGLRCRELGATGPMVRARKGEMAMVMVSRSWLILSLVGPWPWLWLVDVSTAFYRLVLVVKAWWRRKITIHVEIYSIGVDHCWYWSILTDCRKCTRTHIIQTYVRMWST